MKELEGTLARTNLGQAALLTVPWTVMQLGGFWALADVQAGVAGGIVVVVIAVAAFLGLSIDYHSSQIRLINLLFRQSGSTEAGSCGCFQLFRFWNDQLELVRRHTPGYVNTLRLNYIALPLAFLAAMLDFWGAALFLILVWEVTGMLVRSAAVRSVTGADSVVSGKIRFRIMLLFVVAVAGWGYVRCQAWSAEHIFREKVAQLRSISFLLSAPDLDAHYRLEGENGAEGVKALKQIPQVPESLKHLAAPVWVENVSPDFYMGVERFVFEHDSFMEFLKKITRTSNARLGFAFEKGFAGKGGAELLTRYRKLEELARLRFYASAAVGNVPRMEESWNMWGALRRHLSGEPLLSVCRLSQEMESRRLNSLERLLNEFGIHSKREAFFFDSDLAVTEEELKKNLQYVIKGEASLYLISGRDPLTEWTCGDDLRSPARIFPVLDWVRWGSLAVYLEGMRRLDAAVADPQQYAAIRHWSEGLPCGVTPGISVLRMADETVLRYFLLMRKLRAGRIALELERYREARGGFPEMLGELKELPDSVRMDPLTGRGMEYRKNGFVVTMTDSAGGAGKTRKIDGAEIGGRAGFRIRR